VTVSARATKTPLLLEPPAFIDQGGAACRSEQVNPDWWYPEPGRTNSWEARMAIRICYSCPLRTPCGEWALRTQERWGIWAGLSERERRKLLRIRRKSIKVATFNGHRGR
jgi:transcription factor WhiB